MTNQDPTQAFEAQPPAPEPPAPAAAPYAPPPAPLASAWTPPGDQYGAPVPPSGADVPIAPVGPRPRRHNPLRWIVAVLVVAVVVAGGLGATLLLTSSTSGTSTVLGYVPADAIAYGEVRLDLPGSQRAEVAKSLSAFPGFADQASLDTKLGELYDRIIKAATNDKHDYQTEIAPWFDGQLAMAIGPTGQTVLASAGGSPAPSPTISPTAGLPACTGGETPMPSASPVAEGFGMVSMNTRELVLASVKDAAKAGAWVASILGEQGVTTSDRTCDGVVVHVIASSSSHLLVPDPGWAVLGGKVLVAGDLDSIRLAIATKGAGGLSTTPDFQKAVAALPGDHIGFMYEAIAATYAAQLDSISARDTDGTLTALYKALSGILPSWIAGDLKAANGNLVIDTAEPATDGQSTTNRTSDLAGLAPSSTIALVDVRDLGKTLGALKDKLAADPKLETYVKQFDTALGLAGGFAGTIGWIGDAGVAITRDGSNVSGGVIIRPDDASAAGRLFTQLRSLADLSGAGSGISINDEQYKGATITSVDLSGLAPLLESQAGSGLGGMSVPGNLKFVYAATDKVVVLTLDSAFAKAVIDASQGGGSLAGSARFSALVSLAGDKSTGLVWLDVAALRELVEGAMPPDQKAKYESDVKPYLLPIDALVSSSVADNGLNRGTMILSIKH